MYPLEWKKLQKPQMCPPPETRTPFLFFSMLGRITKEICVSMQYYTVTAVAVYAPNSVTRSTTLSTFFVLHFVVALSTHAQTGSTASKFGGKLGVLLRDLDLCPRGLGV